MPLLLRRHSSLQHRRFLSPRIQLPALNTPDGNQDQNHRRQQPAPQPSTQYVLTRVFKWVFGSRGSGYGDHEAQAAGPLSEPQILLLCHWWCLKRHANQLHLLFRVVCDIKCYISNILHIMFSFLDSFLFWARFIAFRKTLVFVQFLVLCFLFLFLFFCRCQGY